MQRGDHLLHPRLRPAEQRLDRSVPPVPDPALQPQRARFLAHPAAEPDPLNPAAYHRFHALIPHRELPAPGPASHSA